MFCFIGFGVFRCSVVFWGKYLMWVLICFFVCVLVVVLVVVVIGCVMFFLLIVEMVGKFFEEVLEYVGDMIILFI